MSQVGLLSLPAELIELVADFATPETAAVLSATCKAYSDLLGLRATARLRTTAGATQVFFALLVDQHPDWLYCTICRKSYEWKKALSYPRFCCPGRSSADHGIGLQMCGIPGETRLFREVRDLMLRYHRYGIDFGLQPSYIEHKNCIGPSSKTDKWAVKMDFDANIMNGRLYIRRQDRVRVKLWSPEQYKQLWKLRDRPCPHVGNSIAAMAACLVHHVWISDVAKSLSALRERKNKCQTMKHCSYCATDFMLSLEVFAWSTKPQKPLVEVIVKLDSYQDLGPRFTVPGSAAAAHFGGPKPAILHRQDDRSTFLRNLQHDFFYCYPGRLQSELNPVIGGFDRLEAFDWNFGQGWMEIVHEDRDTAWKKTSVKLNESGLQSKLRKWTKRSICDLQKIIAADDPASRIRGHSKQYKLPECECFHSVYFPHRCQCPGPPWYKRDKLF